VLVGPQQVLTCAHVVNVALGRDRAAQDRPAVEVTVAFAVGDDPPQPALVQRWWPPPRTGAIGNDIAGLVLTGTELPAGATPARLAANPPAPGQVVDVFGYTRHARTAPGWRPPSAARSGPSPPAGLHCRQRAADPAGVQRQPGV
jgi:trypsin